MAETAVSDPSPPHALWLPTARRQLDRSQGRRLSAQDERIWLDLRGRLASVTGRNRDAYSVHRSDLAVRPPLPDCWARHRCHQNRQQRLSLRSLGPNCLASCFPHIINPLFRHSFEKEDPLSTCYSPTVTVLSIYRVAILREAELIRANHAERLEQARRALRGLEKPTSQPDRFLFNNTLPIVRSPPLSI